MDQSERAMIIIIMNLPNAECLLYFDGVHSVANGVE